MPPSKNISFEELSKYFHLPINQVAKELGVCATILKKICRRNHIPRWPHRKIKSLDKMVDNLNINLAKNPQEKEEILQEIEILKSKKLEIMMHPDILVKPQHGDHLKTIGPMKKSKLPSHTATNPYSVDSFKMRDGLESSGKDALEPISCFQPSSENSFKPVLSLPHPSPSEPTFTKNAEPHAPSQERIRLPECRTSMESITRQDPLPTWNFSLPNPNNSLPALPFTFAHLESPFVRFPSFQETPPKDSQTLLLQPQWSPDTTPRQPPTGGTALPEWFITERKRVLGK